MHAKFYFREIFFTCNQTRPNTRDLIAEFYWADSWASIQVADLFQPITQFQSHTAPVHAGFPPFQFSWSRRPSFPPAAMAPPLEDLTRVLAELASRLSRPPTGGGDASAGTPFRPLLSPSPPPSTPAAAGAAPHPEPGFWTPRSPLCASTR